jgi:hypothetical protein
MNAAANGRPEQARGIHKTTCAECRCALARNTSSIRRRSVRRVHRARRALCCTCALVAQAAVAPEHLEAAVPLGQHERGAGFNVRELGNYVATPSPLLQFRLSFPTFGPVSLHSLGNGLSCGSGQSARSARRRSYRGLDRLSVPWHGGELRKRSLNRCGFSTQSYQNDLCASARQLPKPIWT